MYVNKVVININMHTGAKSACAAAVEIAPSKGARMGNTYFIQLMLHRGKFNISDRLLLAVPLSVAGAFHTSFMQPAVDKLKTALAEVKILTPRIPVVSNVDAKPHFDPEGDCR